MPRLAKKPIKADMDYLNKKFAEVCQLRPEPPKMMDEESWKQYLDQVRAWKVQKDVVAKNILKKKGYPEELYGLIQEEWSSNNDLYVKEITCYCS